MVERKHGSLEGSDKVVIIGLDGATFDIINPLVASGKLPQITRLIREGVSGELESTIPPLSPNAWSSFATGKNAGKHGIYSFSELKPDSYQIRYVNAGLRQGATLWSILSREGRRVGVVNVPITYPPEPVNGFLISGIDAPSSTSQIAYPAELLNEIRREVGDYIIEYPLLGVVDAKGGGSIIRNLHRVEELRAATTKYLMSKYPWDLLVVVFIAIDRVQHFFWHAMEPRHYRYHEEGAEQYRMAILDTYEKMDQLVGDILAGLDEEITLMVISDHGAGPFDDTLPYLNLNDWLVELGLLKLRSQGHSPTQRLLRGIRSVARKSLTPGLKSELKKRFSSLQERVQSHLYFSVIDWSQTKAFASYDEFLARGIRINLKGREPEGIVEPEEYERLRGTLIDQLKGLCHPVTGNPVVREVYKREEIYSGPCLEKAPDLVVSWAEEAFFSGSPPSKREERFRLSHLRRSGEHRQKGIFMAKGPHLKRGAQVSGAEITDITPTLLYLLGLAIPNDMDGRVLTEIFEDEFLRRTTIRYRDPDEERDGRERGYSEEEAEQIRERLEGLGYLQ